MTRESIKLSAKEMVIELLEKNRDEVNQRYENANRQFSAVESSDYSETKEGKKHLESIGDSIDILWETEKILEGLTAFLGMI